MCVIHGGDQMARKATSKATEESVQLRIVVEANQDTPTYYMNHVEIVMGLHEIALWFARLPTKPSRAEMADAAASGEIVVDPEFQIVIPHTLMSGLISALQSVQTKHVETFGTRTKAELQ